MLRAKKFSAALGLAMITDPGWNSFCLPGCVHGWKPAFLWVGTQLGWSIKAVSTHPGNGVDAYYRTTASSNTAHRRTGNWRKEWKVLPPSGVGWDTLWIDIYTFSIGGYNQRIPCRAKHHAVFPHCRDCALSGGFHIADVGYISKQKPIQWPSQFAQAYRVILSNPFCTSCNLSGTPNINVFWSRALADSSGRVCLDGIFCTGCEGQLDFSIFQKSHKIDILQIRDHRNL